MITTLDSIKNTDCATGVVDFPAAFKITDKAHVYVYYIDGETAEVLLTQVAVFSAIEPTPKEYKVNAISDTGFNVELSSAYATSDGRKISIRRVVPLTQEIDYPEGNDFPSAIQERALDKLTAIIQQFNELLSRQIGMPLSEDIEATTLPALIPNYYLGLDGSNNLIWKVGTVAVGSDEIKDSMIDWGVGSEQVSAVDMPIADAGSIITATEVEGALQEVVTALNVVAALLDQSVVKAATPLFAGVTLKGSSDVDRNIEFASDADLLWDESEDEFYLNKSLKVNGGVETDGTKLKTKIIEIGDWDMEHDITKIVIHTISNFKKIRRVDGVIRNDEDGTYYNINTSNNAGNCSVGVNSISATTLKLIRTIGGDLATSNFNIPISYNRGWLTITYEV